MTLDWALVLIARPKPMTVSPMASVSRIVIRRRISDLHRELIDVGGGVTRALVDPHDRLARRPGREAEHPAGVGIEPGALEVHALLRLDREVPPVRFVQLLRRDTEEARMHVHELGHRYASISLARRRSPSSSGTTVFAAMASVIGRMTDDARR